MSGDAANPADYSLSGPAGIAVISIGTQSAFVTLTSDPGYDRRSNEKAVMTLTVIAVFPEQLDRQFNASDRDNSGQRFGDGECQFDAVDCSCLYLFGR